MTDTAKDLVERFYHVLWNRAETAAAPDLLAADLRFRGSLGPERRGRDGFLDYLAAVHRALGAYRCRIDTLITTEDHAAARMTFSGTHQAEFFGIPATGKEISWSGAAFFRIKDGLIAEIWVLGDIDSIKRQLGAGHRSPFSAS